MKHKDFFFGEVNEGRDGPNLCLNSMAVLADKVSAEFFTAQLNRLLNEQGGSVSFNDQTSHPNFRSFIDKVAKDHVGFIELYARKDVNANVEATLACDIFLLNGVISVKTSWCAYKEIRANEIISTCLVPLHLKALQEKTYIRWDDGDTERLVQDGDFQAELEKVFKLAKYPLGMAWGSTNELTLKEYMNVLKCATDVGLGGLASEPASDSFMEFHRNKTM